MLETWIWKDNLRPFLEFASFRAGYEFDELDWEAVRYGMGKTDADADAWFAYSLEGDRTVEIAAANDPEGSIIQLRLKADRRTLAALDAATTLMAEYVLRRE
jgi:hypothetical protein